MSPIPHDVTALLNILANGGEIAGISAGLPLLVLSFIPHANGLKGYTSKLAILGLVMAIVGLAYPGIMNIMVEALDNGAIINSVVAAVVTLTATVFLLGSWLVAVFIPSIIAVRERRNKRLWIIGCNCIAFLPGAWLVSFIWACMSDKTPAESQVN